MSESLVIRLDPRPAQSASWVAVDDTGAISGPVSYGDLAEATPAASGRQVIVLVPAADVLRAPAIVPVKSGNKLLQALPFALEELLADDVDALHFAAGARDAEGRVQAAVVRGELMDDWVERLAAAGLVAQKLYSEADAVAGMPNTATLLIQEDGAVVVEPDGAVTAIDADGVDSMLQLWLARQAASAETTGPLHVVAYGSAATLAALDPLWDELRPKVESLDVRVLAEGPLPRLAAQIVTTPGVNLLQGAYARRSSLMSYWPAWQTAAILLVTLAVLATVVQFAETRRVKAQVAQLDATIDQAFHYVFPDAGPIQDARGELSSRLQQLGDGGDRGSHEFLDALQVLAKALSGADSSARIEALNYRSGSLELRIRAPNVESLDRIQQAVSSAGGLKAQIQSANASGDQVVGRLQITKAGS